MRLATIIVWDTPRTRFVVGPCSFIFKLLRLTSGRFVLTTLRIKITLMIHSAFILMLRTPFTIHERIVDLSTSINARCLPLHIGRFSIALLILRAPILLIECAVRIEGREGIITSI